MTDAEQAETQENKLQREVGAWLREVSARWPDHQFVVATQAGKTVNTQEGNCERGGTAVRLFEAAARQRKAFET